MRARYPDHDGFVERDGVKVVYEVFGSGQPAIVFPPIWTRSSTPAPGRRSCPTCPAITGW